MVELLLVVWLQWLGMYLFYINSICLIKSNPRSLIPPNVEITSLSSADTADLVIVALPKDFYHTIPAHLLRGKVVVDVSNRSSVKRNSTE